MAAPAPRSIDPGQALRTSSVFARLPDPAVADLARVTQLGRLAPGQALARAPELGERYAFILDGQMAVAVDRARTGADRKFFKNRPDREIAYLDLLERDDFVSDAYLPVQSESSEARLECLALVSTQLAYIPRSALAPLMRRHTAWASEMEARNQALRERHQRHQRPDLRLVQDFFLRYGYSFATTLKLIDLSRCIGCNACEDACAGRHGTSRLVRHGPVFGLLSFPVACRTCADHRCVNACGFDAMSFRDAEVKVDQKKCVGCTACQAACPNDVIQMVTIPYQVSDFPNPMPDTTPAGRTNVEGLYLVGEAGGDALIKMAINSGVRAVEELAPELATGTVAGVLDLVIVGSGPAGLSAALTAKAKGLRFAILDKGTIASTIRSYPRHKVVMAEPAHIPLYGDLWLKDTTKEELIEKWSAIIRETGLEVRTEEEVLGVSRGADGLFEVRTGKGAHRARRVVLATGNRGAPRKLGVPGERPGRVEYVLTEPDHYAGKRVLVVGGGDSAVEAAMSLADVPGTQVTLSYRRDSFGRIKARNKERLDELSGRGALRVVLSSSVTRVEEGSLRLKVEGQGEQTLANDAILALLGAEPPTKLFQDAGIRILEPNTPDMARLAASRGMRSYASKCDHCAGHADQACIRACPTEAIFEVKPESIFPNAGLAVSGGSSTELFVRGVGALPELGTRPSRTLGIIARVSLLLVLLLGVECFLRVVLPEVSLAAWLAARAGAPAPGPFRSGEGLGFWLGVLGTTLMTASVLYPLHSRLGVGARWKRSRVVLGLHVLAGILGPAMVSYHTRLKLDRWPSIAFWAMWGVVLSGLLGRYAFAGARKGAGLFELDRHFDHAPLSRKAGRGVLARRLTALAAALHRAAARVATPWRVLHLLFTVVLVVGAILHITLAMMFKAS